MTFGNCSRFRIILAATAEPIQNIEMLPVIEQYANHITEENEKQKEEINALNGDIKELTTELVRKRGRRGTGKDADLAAELENLEEEFGRVRDKLSREQTEISKLREKLADSEAYRTQAFAAKSESDAKVVDQGRRIDDLGKELLKAMSFTKNAEILSKESNKVKGDTVKETKRLLEENEHMQNEVLISLLSFMSCISSGYHMRLLCIRVFYASQSYASRKYFIFWHQMSSSSLTIHPDSDPV